MNARDTLELALLRYFSGEHVTRESAGELERLQANGLIDAFAHELAEKQRAKASTFAMLRSEDMRMRAQGLRMGADLIDPMEGGDRGQQ
ncbi:hypothetical protein ACFUJU_07855 [Streptomyces sp. NPDC057235]|uniref:hypothetical protein n=1 Tax=Streptomyces sp. NPDC057235 TaxID=3346058 RepID=UPI003636C7B5